MANNEYTKKQLAIINGEVPIESVNGHCLRWFYEKAISNNDIELANKINKRTNILKTEAYERTKKRSRERMLKIWNEEEIQWRQPKSNEYTEREKKIVRGEIELNDAHANILVSICMKARNLGDIGLSERIYDIILSRREMERQKMRNSGHQAKFVLLEKGELDSKSCLTPLEQSLINGFIDWDHFTEDQINRIINKLQKHDENTNLEIAQYILYYIQNPLAIYVVSNHREAIDLMESLLQKPIRRPDTWFMEDKQHKGPKK